MCLSVPFGADMLNQKEKTKQKKNLQFLNLGFKNLDQLVLVSLTQIRLRNPQRYCPLVDVNRREQ